jgi:general secretion pathway protein I
MKFLPNNQKGFTLLEVMIAVAIIGVGIGAILIAENNSLDTTFRAKRMTTVAMLAKNSLIEAERELEGKTFDESKKEASGTFDAPNADYQWERKIVEITFPNIMEGSGAATDGADASKSGPAEPIDANTEKVVKLATQFLSKSTREIQITIKWKDKGQDQKFSVSQYWVDLNHEFSMSEQ